VSTTPHIDALLASDARPRPAHAEYPGDHTLPLRPRSASPPPNLDADAETVAAGPEVAAGPRFTFADSSEFLAGDYRMEYLIQGVLAKLQPGVIGGPQKTLKTSLIVDAAVSIATATPFLGQFPVRKRNRVAICSGESGAFTLKETCLRVLEAKQIDAEELTGWLKWEFRLPTFSDAEIMTDFATGLAALEVDVVLVDPTYLALGEADAKSVFDMGRVLCHVSEHLVSRNITPLLVHHANRQLPAGEVMGLEHLSHAGFGEFARQWILLSRREKYTGDGTHALWANVGGSAGHGGIYALDVDEGKLAPDGSGKRHWNVTVQNLHDVRVNEVQARETAKTELATRKRAEERTKFLNAMDAECITKPAATKNKLKERTGFNSTKLGEVSLSLLEDEVIEEHKFDRETANSAKLPVVGFRRFRPTPGTPGQNLFECSPSVVPQVELEHPGQQSDELPPLGGQSDCPGVPEPAPDPVPRKKTKSQKRSGVQKRKAAAK